MMVTCVYADERGESQVGCDDALAGVAAGEQGARLPDRGPLIRRAERP